MQGAGRMFFEVGVYKTRTYVNCYYCGEADALTDYGRSSARDVFRGTFINYLGSMS